MDDLITVREAARQSDLTTGYINQLIRKGKIKGHKVGWSYLIERESFSEWLKKRNQQKQEDANNV